MATQVSRLKIMGVGGNICRNNALEISRTDEINSLIKENTENLT